MEKRLRDMRKKGEIDMARPSKPAKVIEMENKSHRTKKELRTRKQAEESLLSGTMLKESKEVEGNPRAHKEFLRVRKLLSGIEKSDDLYGSVINRYCLTLAECADFEEKREHAQKLMDKLEERSGEMEFKEFLKLQDGLAKQLISYDKQIQAKRKMLFDIEKENVMTIASALRSIPKTPEKKNNALKEALSG